MIFQRYTFIFAITLMLGLIALVTPQPLHAQSSNSNVTVAHTPLKPDQLPPPGINFKLSTVLLNSKDSQLQIRALIARDGKIMDIMLPHLSTDQSDRLVYSADIPAPLAELSYQFFIMNKGEVMNSSSHYSVRRECLPDVTPVDTSIGLGGGVQNKIETLRDYASRLQVEVTNLEQVVDIIELLDKMTERPNG